MSVSPRPAHDRWRDTDGTHIPDGCRVEQVAVASEHGALPSRLTKCGEVIGRGTDRVNVRFGGESKVASVRPAPAARAQWAGLVMGTPRRPRAAHAAQAADRTVPLPLGTRVMRTPVEPWTADRRRPPPRYGTVMSHATAVGSRGRFSVRWDSGIWEAQLDVSDVTAVEEEATVTPLSSRRTRAVS